MDTGINVLIADDSQPFRVGLHMMLNSVADMRIVGEASDGAEAINMAVEFQPDVILMDLHMPDVHGIEATRQIVQTSPHIGILVLTMFDDDDSVFAAMRSGARGYLLKGADQEEITRAIRAVNNGEAIFSPAIARRLISYFSVMKPLSPPEIFPELTKRELEILMLIAKGSNNTEIADHFVISEKTVRNHVSNIYAKLQVVDRAQAIIRARDAGLS